MTLLVRRRRLIAASTSPEASSPLSSSSRTGVWLDLVAIHCLVLCSNPPQSSVLTALQHISIKRILVLALS